MNENDFKLYETLKKALDHMKDIIDNPDRKIKFPVRVDIVSPKEYEEMKRNGVIDDNPKTN